MWAGTKYSTEIAASEPSNKRKEETKSNEQPDSKNVTKYMMNISS